jgi:hypothetical protein
MSADPYARVSRTDDFLAAFGKWVSGTVHRVGVDAWNYAPEMRQTRERAARIGRRASANREAELDRLAASGISRERSRRYLSSRRDTRQHATRAAR